MGVIRSARIRPSWDDPPSSTPGPLSPTALEARHQMGTHRMDGIDPCFVKREILQISDENHIYIYSVNGNWKENRVGICSQPGSGVLVSLRQIKVRSNGDGNWRSTNRLSVQTLPFTMRVRWLVLSSTPLKKKSSPLGF